MARTHQFFVVQSNSLYNWAQLLVVSPNFNGLQHGECLGLGDLDNELARAHLIARLAPPHQCDGLNLALALVRADKQMLPHVTVLQNVVVPDLQIDKA